MHFDSAEPTRLFHTVTAPAFSCARSPTAGAAAWRWFAQSIVLLFVGAVILVGAVIVITKNSEAAKPGNAVSFPPAVWDSQPPAWVD